MKKVLCWLEQNLEGLIDAILRAGIVILMSIQIVCRYFLKAPLVWPEEMARFLNIWAVFFALPWTIRLGLEMRVDPVVNMLPGGLKTFVEETVRLFSFLLVCYLFYWSFDVVKLMANNGTKGSATGIPFVFVYSATIGGFGMAIIRYIQFYVKKLRRLLNDRKPAGEERAE